MRAFYVYAMTFHIEYNSLMSSIMSSFLHTLLLIAWTITWLSICNVILLLDRFLHQVFNLTTTIYNSCQAIANCLKYALSPVSGIHNHWFPKVAPAPMSLASDHSSMVFAVTHGNGNMHSPLWFVTFSIHHTISLLACTFIFTL